MKTSSYNCKRVDSRAVHGVFVFQLCACVCHLCVCVCLSASLSYSHDCVCVCRVYLQFQQEVMGISDIWKFDLSEGCPLDIEVTAFSAYTGSWKARTGTQVFYLIIQVLPYPNLSLIHYAAWFGESGRWYAGIRGGPRFASYGGSRGGVGGYLEGGGYVSLAQTPPPVMGQSGWIIDLCEK